MKRLLFAILVLAISLSLTFSTSSVYAGDAVGALSIDPTEQTK